MPLKKKKSQHQDDWGGFDKHLAPLMKTPEVLERELREGGYLEKDGTLSLERQFDYMRDQGIVKLYKRNPNGQNKAFRDLGVVVCREASNRFDAIERTIAKWRDKKGYIDKQKTMHLISLTEKYKPKMLQTPEPPKPIPKPVTPPPKPTGKDPRIINLNDIQI